MPIGVKETIEKDESTHKLSCEYNGKLYNIYVIPKGFETKDNKIVPKYYLYNYTREINGVTTSDDYNVVISKAYELLRERITKDITSY